MHAEIIILYHHLGNKIFLIKTTVSVFVNDLGGEGENLIQLGLKVFFFLSFFLFLILLSPFHELLFKIRLWEAGRGLGYEL